MNIKRQNTREQIDGNIVEHLAEEVTPQVRSDPLPAPLYSYMAKLFGGVFITAILIIMSTILLRQAKTLLFLAIPGYLGFKAFLVQRDWELSIIHEVEAYCRFIRPGTLRDQVVVSFCSLDEDGEANKHYQFVIPGRKNAEEFIPESPYLIYFRDSEPRNLLAFTQI